MSKMDIVRKMLIQVLNDEQSNVKYLSIKDISRKIKEEISVEELYNTELSGIDIYRTLYQIGLNGKGFTLEKDETTTYIRMI